MCRRHFPDGKAELAIEAVTAAGRAIGEGIEFLLESSDDVGEAVGRVLDFLAADLRESDFQHGCPVGTVALDIASCSEPIRLACSEIFDEWLEKIERRLRVAGWSEQAAADQAFVIVSGTEGALILARSRRDAAPVEAMARHSRATLKQPPPMS